MLNYLHVKNYFYLFLIYYYNLYLKYFFFNFFYLVHLTYIKYSTMDSLYYIIKCAILTNIILKYQLKK